MNLRIAIAIFAMSTLSAFAGQPVVEEGPKPLTQEERNPDWLVALERLRLFPRPGDIQNAGVLANIGDVLEMDAAQRDAILVARKEYDAGLQKKAMQWEGELKSLRAEAEARILAGFPPPRRETARKILELSHEKWSPPLETEARIRGEFLDKKSTAEKAASPEEADAAKKEFVGWIKKERARLAQVNVETLTAIKALLTPEEAARLNEFDKNKVVPPKKAK